MLLLPALLIPLLMHLCSSNLLQLQTRRNDLDTIATTDAGNIGHCQESEYLSTLLCLERLTLSDGRRYFGSNWFDSRRRQLHGTSAPFPIRLYELVVKGWCSVEVAWRRR